MLGTDQSSVLEFSYGTTPFTFHSIRCGRDTKQGRVSCIAPSSSCKLRRQQTPQQKRVYPPLEGRPKSSTPHFSQDCEDSNLHLDRGPILQPCRELEEIIVRTHSAQILKKGKVQAACLAEHGEHAEGQTSQWSIDRFHYGRVDAHIFHSTMTSKLKIMRAIAKRDKIHNKSQLAFSSLKHGLLEPHRSRLNASRGIERKALNRRSARMKSKGHAHAFRESKLKQRDEELARQA